MQKNKYAIRVWSFGGSSGIVIDVYEICRACEVSCGATQHAIKKLLFAGKRGVKPRLQDLMEARDAIDRAIEIEGRQTRGDDGRAAGAEDKEHG